MAPISAQVVRSLSGLERPVGRQELAKALQWDSFDEEDEPRKGIILDFYYDNLMFCTNKGMPWDQIGVLMDLASTVLIDSTGKSLHEAIKIYSQECQTCCGKVSSNNLKVFTEYFFETFMHHYKLFQFVMTKDQEDSSIKTDVFVETPEELLPFTEAKEAPLWEYEQKLKQVEISEETRQQEREVEFQTKAQELDQNLTTELENFQKAETPLEQESLVKLINTIASAHIGAVGHKIKADVSSTIEDLNFMLEKTSIPRPQELGAPPRYKPKTPITVPKQSKPAAKDKPAAPKSGKSRNQSRTDAKSAKTK